MIFLYGVFKTFHRFPIGFKSGLFAGHSSFFSERLSNQAFEALLQCTGAPSSISVKIEASPWTPRNGPNVASYTVSTKSAAVRRPGGMKIRGSFLSARKAPQTIIEEWPLLKFGAKQSRLCFSLTVRQTSIYREFSPISKDDSSVHMTRRQSARVQFLCALANAGLWAMCLALRNGFRAATQAWKPISWRAARIAVVPALVAMEFVMSASERRRFCMTRCLSDLFSRSVSLGGLPGVLAIRRFRVCRSH